jgi:hypothetical protein
MPTGLAESRVPSHKAVSDGFDIPYESLLSCNNSAKLSLRG